MRKVTIGITLLSSLLGLAIVSNVFSLSETIVISAVQVRDTSSSTNESITLTNNTSGDIDVTGWCLQYASSSTSVLSQQSVAWRSLACISTADEVTHIMLPPHQSAVAVSKESGWVGDLSFSATLANSAGHVRLIDGDGNEVDKLGWGNARYPESTPAPTPAIGKMLQRSPVGTPPVYVDSDINAIDFLSVDESSPSAYGALYAAADRCENIAGFQQFAPIGMVIDESHQCYIDVDVCPNIEGREYQLPVGYDIDGSGNCQPDVCGNIVGLQQDVPIGMEVTTEQACQLIDVCPNLDDAQSSVPEHYLLSDGLCFKDVLPLSISELQPNVSGSDAGQEFIELYNPNSTDVQLQHYVIYMGKSLEHVIVFDTTDVIAAGSYKVIYNDQYDFILLNTNDRVALAADDGRVIDEPPGYVDPPEDQSWAKIGGVWAYTNRPTPGLANLPSLIAQTTVATVSTAKPCSTGLYRNPLTGRCKQIAAEVEPAACEVGWYRNPATNRCKKLESSTTLAECKAGQERNPATNRCRNVSTSSAPSAKYAVLSARNGNETGSLSVLTVTILIIVLLAIAYASWEWRQEIVTLAKKFRLAMKRR